MINEKDIVELFWNVQNYTVIGVPKREYFITRSRVFPEDMYYSTPFRRLLLKTQGHNNLSSRIWEEYDILAHS